MAVSVKANGTYKEATDFHVKVGGKWRQGVEVLTKVDGVWKQVWKNVITLYEADGYEQTVEVKGATAGNILTLQGVMLTATYLDQDFDNYEESFSIGAPSLSTTWRQMNIMYGTRLVAVASFGVSSSGDLLVDFSGQGNSTYGENIVLTINKITRG